MFILDWSSMARILVVGSLAYVSLIILLRISGKRTLSKLNAFDLIVTVAIGSTLSTVLLDSNIALPEGVLALALLIFLQFIFAWSSYRSKPINSLIKSEPRLLYLDGQFMEGAMQEERVQKIEMLQAARTEGMDSLDKVKAIVLETDGSMSMIKKSNEKEATSSMINVKGMNND